MFFFLNMKMRVFSYEKSIFLFSYLPIGRPNEKKQAICFLKSICKDQDHEINTELYLLYFARVRNSSR
jgi:hypothetical protein